MEVGLLEPEIECSEDVQGFRRVSMSAPTTSFFQSSEYREVLIRSGLKSFTLSVDSKAGLLGFVIRGDLTIKKLFPDLEVFYKFFMSLSLVVKWPRIS